MEETKTLDVLRFERGKMTQLDLYLATGGKQGGVSQARISMLENGKYIPTPEERRKIAEALMVDESEVRWPELAGGSDEVQDAAV